MMGAQLLLAMSARRSRRAFSISVMYSAFTAGAAASEDIVTADVWLFSTSLTLLVGAEELWFGAGDGSRAWFCSRSGAGKEGGWDAREEWNRVEAWRKHGIFPDESNILVK